MSPFDWLTRLWGPNSPRGSSPRDLEDPRLSLYPDFHVTALEARRVLNAAPMITPQEFGVNENAEMGQVVAAVEAFDSDPGDQLSFAITAGNTGDTFAIDSMTGVISVASTEVLGDEAPFDLTVEVTDPGGLSASATISISVNPFTTENDAPLINPQQFLVPADSPAGTLVGQLLASDPDEGDTMTFSILSGNTNDAFEVDPNTGILTVAEAADVATPQTFTLTVQVADAEGAADTTTVRIRVNGPPTGIDLDNLTVPENEAGATVGTVSVTDPNSDDQFTFVLNDSRFEIIGGDLKLKENESLDFESEMTVELLITVTDSGGATFQQQFLLEVLDRNDPPTDITLGNLTVEENDPGAVVGLVTVVDEDDPETSFGTHTFEVREGLEGNAASTRFTVDENLQLRLIDGVFLNFEVEPSVILRIEATDNPGGGMNRLSVERTFTIVVEDVNDPPVANNKSFVTLKNSLLEGNVLVGGPGDTQDSDEDVGDTITVVQINGEPLVAGQPIVLASGATLMFDAQGDFTYNFSTSPQFATLQVGQVANDSFTYTISDSHEATATATVQIEISGANIPPTVNPSASAEGVEGELRLFEFDDLFVLIGGFDPDTPPEFLRIVITDVLNGELILSGGLGGPGTLFTFDPDENFNGDLLFNYQLEDRIDPNNVLTSQVGSGTIAIAPVNTPPELSIPDIEMTEDVVFESVDILRDNYYDFETPAEEALFEVIDASPELMTAEVTELGALRIVPLANYNGPGWVVVRVTDTGDGESPPLSDTQTVTITIAPVDDPPTANPDVFETREDTPVPLVGNVIANDFDVDAIPELNLGLLALPGVTLENIQELYGLDTNSVTFVSPGVPDGGGFVTLPQGGRVQLLANGDFTYEPAPFFFGMESFVYSVSDMQGNTSTATVSIFVTPVNNPPYFDVDPVIELDPLNPSVVLITNAIVGPPNEAQPNQFYPDDASQTLRFSAFSNLPDPTFTQVPGDPTTWRMQFPILPFRSETITLTIRATDTGPGPGEGINASENENRFERQVTVIVVVGQVPASSQQFERRAPAEFPPLEPIELIPSVPVTPILAATPLQEAAATSQSGTQSEREVLVYLVTRDGSGELKEDLKLTLDPEWLENINGVFRELPDDRFRIYLKLEDGSRRLVVDVFVRDGRPFTPDDTGDEVILPEVEVEDEQDEEDAEGSGDDSTLLPSRGPAELPPILEGPNNARPLPESPLGGVSSGEAPASSAWPSVRWGLAAGGIALLGTRRQRQAATAQALAELADRPLRRFSPRLFPQV